jgi:hypothetical protein
MNIHKLQEGTKEVRKERYKNLPDMINSVEEKSVEVIVKSFNPVTVCVPSVILCDLRPAGKFLVLKQSSVYCPDTYQ